uniref:Uncharacterized protein n=1 Tax=Arundo donax TaxID=35708 RepID=A0A0A9E617_ARUDO
MEPLALRARSSSASASNSIPSFVQILINRRAMCASSILQNL